VNLGFFKQEFDRSYLVLPAEDTEKFELKMITQNHIPGFLSCKVHHDEEDTLLYYDVTSKRSLERMYQDKTMSFAEMRNLFFRLGQMIRDTADYLLESRYLRIDPECIFLDLETDEISGLYYPYETEEQEAEECIPRIGKYHLLADFFLEKINHKDEEAVNAAYRFYKMSKEEFFSFEVFLTILEKETVSVCEEPVSAQPVVYRPPSVEEYFKDEEDEPKEKRMLSVVKPAIILGIGIIMNLIFFLLPQLGSFWWCILIGGMGCVVCAVFLLIKEVCFFLKLQQEKKYEVPKEVLSMDEFFGEEGDYKTTFFQEDNISAGRIRWEENGEIKESIVGSGSLIIGKQKSKADIVISHLSVSRQHARIRKEKNGYVITDLHSTNGTYINGEPIAPGEEVKVSAKDEIRIGKIAIDVV